MSDDPVLEAVNKLWGRIAKLEQKQSTFEAEKEELRARFEAEKAELLAQLAAEREEWGTQSAVRIAGLVQQNARLVRLIDPGLAALAQQLPAHAQSHYVSWADANCRNGAIKVSSGGYRVTGSGAQTHEVARAASGVTEGVHCFAVRVEDIGGHFAAIFVGWCDAQLNVSASSFTGHNGALGASFYMQNGHYYHSGPANGHHEAPAGGGVGAVERPATIAALLDLDAGRMTVYVDGTALAPCAYAFPKDREWFPHVSLFQGGSLVSLDLEAAVAAARGAPA